MGHDFIKNVAVIEGRIEKTNKTTSAWQAEDTANANTLKRSMSGVFEEWARLLTGGERGSKWRSQSGNDIS